MCLLRWNFKRKPKDDKLICKEKDLELFIKQFMNSYGWDVSDFGTLLNLVGIKTPATLDNFKAGEGAFRCTDPAGESFYIVLEPGALFDRIPVIKIIQGERVQRYTINCKTASNQITAYVCK